MKDSKLFCKNLTIRKDNDRFYKLTQFNLAQFATLENRIIDKEIKLTPEEKPTTLYQKN